MNLREFSLPLADPLSTASGTIEAREGLLVRLDGGLGEATPLPGWTEPLDACRSALQSAAERYRDGDETAALDALAETPAARHGLDLALADCDAREAHAPLYRHLGGDEPVETVPVNVTIGDADVPETVAAARRATEAGYPCLKVKVGARPVDADVERLTAVRDAAGTDVELRADANGAWSRDEARRALDGFARAEVSYVEQPLAPGDLDGHAALRAGPVDVALDESLASLSPEEAIDADAADVVICKPMVLGGVRRAREVALAAREAGLEPVVTTTIDGVVARAAAVHLAASLAPIRPCGLATAGRLATDLGPDPAPVDDGRIRVPQTGGTGVHVE